MRTAPSCRVARPAIIRVQHVRRGLQMQCQWAPYSHINRYPPDSARRMVRHRQVKLNDSDHVDSTYVSCDERTIYKFGGGLRGCEVCRARLSLQPPFPPLPRPKPSGRHLKVAVCANTNTRMHKVKFVRHVHPFTPRLEGEDRSLLAGVLQQFHNQRLKVR